mgnify:CR=1 FL=1
MKPIKKQTPEARATTAGVSFLTAPMDRRTFLRRSGLAVGGTAVAGALPLSFMRKAKAKSGAEVDPKAEIKTVRTICTHCSVGCGVIAEVKNTMLRLPITGPMPPIGTAMALIPCSVSPTDEAYPSLLVRATKRLT